MAIVIGDFELTPEAQAAPARAATPPDVNAEKADAPAVEAQQSEHERRVRALRLYAH